MCIRDRIVGSIISLGKNLGFRVVAEWVENEEIRNVLLDLGCTMFQGYLYLSIIHI